MIFEGQRKNKFYHSGMKKEINNTHGMKFFCLSS
jgi:hypothetical protein